MPKILPFRKPRGRRRPLLESPWLMPVLGLAAAAGFYGPAAVSGPVSTPAPAALVEQGAFGLCWSRLDRNCVVDGDTIRIAGETIRLLDIDAPEVFDYKCPSEKARGDRATRRLLALLNSGEVSVTGRGGRDTDKHGRSLRVVSVDGRSAGSVLVSEGLARPWTGQRRPWCI